MGDARRGDARRQRRSGHRRRELGQLQRARGFRAGVVGPRVVLGEHPGGELGLALLEVGGEGGQRRGVRGRGGRGVLRGARRLDAAAAVFVPEGRVEREDLRDAAQLALAGARGQQRLVERAQVAVPVGRRLGQRLEHHRLEDLGDLLLRDDLPRRGRVVVHLLLEHRDERLAAKRRAPGGELVHQDADRVDAGTHVRGAAAGDLRGHEFGRPGRCTRRERPGAVEVAIPAGQRGDPDVEQLDEVASALAVGVALLDPQAHARGRAEVAVHDAALAREDQRVADLVGEGGDVGPRHRTLVAQRDGEGLAVEVLHHVIGEVVAGRAGLEDLDDMLAAQPRQLLSLVQELAGARLGGRVVGAEHAHGDRAAGLDVLAGVDAGDHAAAQRAVEAVAPELAADQLVGVAPQVERERLAEVGRRWREADGGAASRLPLVVVVALVGGGEGRGGGREGARGRRGRGRCDRDRRERRRRGGRGPHVFIVGEVGDGDRARGHRGAGARGDPVAALQRRDVELRDGRGGGGCAGGRGAGG